MKISKCCNASVKVEGDVTHYYVCEMCEKACDVHELKESNMSYDIEKIIEEFKAKKGSVKLNPVGGISNKTYFDHDDIIPWLRSKLEETYRTGRKEVLEEIKYFCEA